MARSAEEKLKAVQIKADLSRLKDRLELIVDTYQDFLAKVINLADQGADPLLVEEARDKACIYFETYLDMHIKHSKMYRQLVELEK